VEQSPTSDTELEKMYRDADEVESFGAESPILAGRLRALLEHRGITTAPRYRIKGVPRSGWVEFKAIVEIFFGSRILCRHKGLAFRTSRSDVVADACEDMNWVLIWFLSLVSHVFFPSSIRVSDVIPNLVLKTSTSSIAMLP
jgi:hypothetical protein